MSEFKRAKYDGNDLIHAGPKCNYISGCGGTLCLNCCEDEMFGDDEDIKLCSECYKSSDKRECEEIRY